MMKNTDVHINQKDQLQNEEVVNFIVFRLGEEEYAVRIENVKEVTLTPTIYKMPRTPNFVEGVANIRGDIIAIIDLEERFSIKKKVSPLEGKKSGGYILVMEHEEYTIGFHVQQVPETLALPVSHISDTPDFFEYSQVNKEFIDGIGKINDRLIIIINIEKVLNSREIAAISNSAENLVK